MEWPPRHFQFWSRRRDGSSYYVMFATCADTKRWWNMVRGLQPCSPFLKENFVFIFNKETGFKLKKHRASCCFTECSKGVGLGRNGFSCFYLVPFFPHSSPHPNRRLGGGPGCLRPHSPMCIWLGAHSFPTLASLCPQHTWAYLCLVVWAFRKETLKILHSVPFPFLPLQSRFTLDQNRIL